MVTRASTPSSRSARTVLVMRQAGSSAPSSRTVGLARDVNRMDPPNTWIRETSVIVSGCTFEVSPLIRCSKPSRIPTTSQPVFRASIVAAEITELIPGAGPPPHRIPSLTIFLPRELPTAGPGHSRPGHLLVSPISGRRPRPCLKARPLGAELERGPPTDQEFIVRKAASLALVVALAIVPAAGAAHSARADSIQERLDRARARHEAAQKAVSQAEDQLTPLLDAYRRL